MDLSRLSMAELERLVDEELAELNPRQGSYALLRTTGVIPATAARLAGYSLSQNPDALEKRTLRARAAYTEKLNRTADINVYWLRTKFLALHDDAMEHGDRGTARACLTEIGKLAALYPEQRLRLQVETAQTSLAEVTEEEWALASRLTHEVRQQLPPATVDISPTTQEEETDAA